MRSVGKAGEKALRGLVPVSTLACDSQPSGHQVQASSSLRSTGPLHHSTYSPATPPPHPQCLPQRGRRELYAPSAQMSLEHSPGGDSVLSRAVQSFGAGSQHKFQYALSKWRAFSGELGFPSSSLLKPPRGLLLAAA